MSPTPARLIRQSLTAFRAGRAAYGLSTWIRTARERDRYGLRPRAAPRFPGFAVMLRRAGSGARALIQRWSRPLPLETLLWALFAILVLCFAIALFTRERAIAP